MTTQAKKITLPFLRHVGGAFLNGKAVCAYGDGKTVQLRAETTGGKHLPKTRVVEMGADEFDALREQWGQYLPGGGSQDVRVVQRALAYLGY
jgi:hypothetical protein